MQTHKTSANMPPNSKENSKNSTLSLLEQHFNTYSLPRVVPMHILPMVYPSFFRHYNDGVCSKYPELTIPRQQLLLLFFANGRTISSKESNPVQETTVRAFTALANYAKKEHRRWHQQMTLACNDSHSTDGALIAS